MLCKKLGQCDGFQIYLVRKTMPERSRTHFTTRSWSRRNGARRRVEGDEPVPVEIRCGQIIRWGGGVLRVGETPWGRIYGTLWAIGGPKMA